jgi:glycosyltransferase involved in cell wall biosynthesis
MGATICDTRAHGFIYPQASNRAPTGLINAHQCVQASSGSKYLGVAVAEPRLTILVPCFNAQATLPGLVKSVADSPLHKTCQMILIDDRSEDGTAREIEQFTAQYPFVEGLFLRQNAGAGVARNLGFAIARGTYTLFFDADDSLDPSPLEMILGIMDRSQAQLAVLPYRYDRGDGTGYTGMNRYDAQVWDDVVGPSDLVVGELSEMPAVLGMSNYPWNKVLRTTHYQQHGLQFGATPVHNDILGHWHAFLHARHIALINAVVCTHQISTHRQHLTTRNSRDRLALFDALDEAYSLIEASPAFRERYAEQFWSFVLRVSEWARARVPYESREEFVFRSRQFVSRIDLSDYFHTLIDGSPSVARQLNKLMLRN